jgi:hypothetical protein
VLSQHLKRKVNVLVPKVSVLKSNKNFSLAHLIIFGVIFAGAGGIIIWSLAATPVLLSQGKPTFASSVEASATQSSGTFGKTTVGTACGDSFATNRKRVNKYPLSTNASISQLSIYLKPTGVSGSQVLNGVIYTDSNNTPGSLLATSNQLTFSSSNAAGWYNLTFASPVSLNAGNYWLGAITGDTGNVAGFCYDSVSNSRSFNSNTYSSGPSNPFGVASIDSEQMSLYASYTYSTTSTNTYSASNATDGNTGTRWSSQFTDPQWIYTDLGQPYNINEVKLSWETAYGKAYQIQVSNDATNWTTIYSTTTGTGGTNDITGLNSVGRYVRMYGTVRGTGWGYSLWEFQVYGTSLSENEVAQGKPATSSSVESTAYPANYGNDGNSGTRWSSQFFDPQWWQVDLGSSMTVDKVDINWETAYASHYQIQTSTDGNTFTTVADVTPTASGLKSTTFNPTSARYVRVNGLTRATQWGYSFWDAKVYSPSSTIPTTPPTTPPPPPAGVPTVTLSANPQSITVGQSSTLTWNSTNATSCTASGGWSGTQNTSGSVTVTPTASTTYSLSCTGAGGSASASAVVTATASGVSVGANPLGPATPTGGWSVEYADAFGSPSKYNGGADNTYWPDSWIGDTGNENPSNPSSEMDYYNPSKVAVDSQGLRLDCSYTGASTFPYTCGEINIGLGGNNHPTTYPGYQFFSYQPGQGDTWALQITTQFPPTTGEADPGFWSSDATWKWEWDMFEGWGYWNNASNWCGDGITDPTWISSGSIQKQVWSNPCSTYGFDPSQGVHTYTTVMLPNNSFEEYVDGKYIHTLSGPVTGAQDMGGIWLQYSLRNVLWSGNNDTNFKSGTRSMHIRSVAVYENKSANHAHTSNGGLIAPGTVVK